MKINDNFKLDFIGIGAEKAGSTWVAEKMSQHPQICLSEPKEIHYFNKKSSYIYNSKNTNFHKSFSWYKKHFLHCKINQKKGEFSTNYLYDQEAPKLIKKYFPNIKIIICLRNPIARAYSQYWMYKDYFKKEKRNFEEAIKKEKEYLDKGLYYKQINNYLKYFKREQMLILLLDDIKKNPDKAIKKLFNFLEVDKNFICKNLNKSANSSKAVRSRLLAKIIGLFSRLLISIGLAKLLHMLKKFGVKKIFMKLNTKKTSNPTMSEVTRKKLQNYFKNDIKKLEKLLSRDLSHWK